MSWRKGILRLPSVKYGLNRKIHNGIIPRYVYLNSFKSPYSDGTEKLPKARTVLKKVMVMERLRSPSRRTVQKLEPVPPGQQPRMKRPRRNILSSVINQPMKKEN